METFWGSSLQEIGDLMSSHDRRKKADLKEKAILCYIIGRNIAERFSGNVTQLWDVFPELFEAERKAYEESQMVDVAEQKEIRRRYVQLFNAQRRGGGS